MHRILNKLSIKYQLCPNLKKKIIAFEQKISIASVFGGDLIIIQPMTPPLRCGWTRPPVGQMASPQLEAPLINNSNI